MADKIDQINGYDIDLPPDATPSIASLTAGSVAVQAGSGRNIGACSISVDTSGVDASASITFSNFGVVGYTSLDSNGIKLYAPLVGTYRLNYPILTADAVIATQAWVEGKNYTTNQGTVTSVAAGTGLSISGTASVNPTVNIASGYKLPTTTEWNSKSSVSGANDGTNWTSITINGTTKTIPSGGGAVYKHTVIFDVGYGFYAQLVYYSSSGTAITTLTSGNFANSILPYSVAVVTNSSSTDYRYVIFKGILGSGKGRYIPYMFCNNGASYVEYYPSQLSIGNPGSVTIISDTVTTP